MSKYQSLIDALNGDDSLFSNVRNGDFRALLADLERAEKALAALAQQAQEPVDELIEFEASMREKHGWVARDFQSDSFGYFDGHTATAWLAWQARAALQTKGQP